MTGIRHLSRRDDHARAAMRRALFCSVAGFAMLGITPALANPAGGKVVAGQASISGEGTDRVRIDQSSDRTIINWDSFSIGAGQGVDFRQPNARSIALNRVTGPEISQIMGELTANGQVYLINGNGIVFGKDARVDVAGLVATSADIGNDAFMAGGALRFDRTGGGDARIVNQGTITIRDAGIAAFVAPQVANQGIITARLGKIAFGGAQAFTLDLHGDNLIRFQVGDAVTRLDDKGALVDIGGVVDARGGSLLITASAARDLVNRSVNIGTQQASAMEVGADGRVTLTAAKMTITAPGEVAVGRNVTLDLSSSANTVTAAARGLAAGGSTQSNIGWV
uniref:two-partner secretion domain-containing protein n=1 Tax=Blastomonas sp. TaxID=1909299 RepID=UPI0035933B0D